MHNKAAVLCAAAMLALAGGAAGASQLLTHRLHRVPVADKEALEAIPARIAGWSLVPSDEPPVNPALLDAFGNPVLVYDKIVSRTYRNADGRQIMLMLAYQREQHQEERVHAPDLCYYAQGFVLTAHQAFDLPLAAGSAGVRAFTAEAKSRREEVVYWIRTGTLLRREALATRSAIFMSGLKGRILDGLLVRVSMFDLPGDGMTSAEKRAMLAQFLQDMTRSSPAATRALLAGPAGA